MSGRGKREEYQRAEKRGVQCAEKRGRTEKQN